MLKSSVFAIAAVMVTVSPAMAKDKKAPLATPGEKQICRSYDTTGSIMPAKRVCHTAAEWRAVDVANGYRVQEMHDHSKAGGYQPGS